MSVPINLAKGLIQVPARLIIDRYEDLGRSAAAVEVEERIRSQQKYVIDIDGPYTR